MLRVYASTNAAEAKDYFSNELSKGDYYSEGQEIAGVWGGSAAKWMGLSGTVDQDAFNALVDNVYPESSPLAGEQITPHNKSNRRPGYDLNFHAPKSLSLLYEYSQDERLLEAFRDAVHNTMESIEDAMHTRVRKDGKDEDRRTGNFAYAEFVHFTARPTDDLPPDPHLHAHCYTLNLTYDSEEEQFKAGQFGHIKGEAFYYEALFHSHLTKSLSDMGLDIARDGRFWTLDGIDKETLKKFSHRTEQIEQFAKEAGIEEKAKKLNIDPNKLKDQLGATTRNKKEAGLTRDQLREKWWQRLDENEKTILDKLSEFEASDDAEPPNFSADETVEYAIKHRLERQSVSSINRLRDTALRQGFGSVSPAEVDNAFINNNELIVVDKQATTKEILSMEKQIISFTLDGYSIYDQLNPNYEIPNTVTDHSTGEQWDVSKEQQKAIHEILNSHHRIQAFEGKAGTGKTTTIASMIDGIEQNGGSAIVLAPTTKAAYEVLKEDGEKYHSEPMKNAHTLARYFVDEKLWKESQGSTLFVDEAGLMSVDDMHSLFALANQFDNRVVLVGDISQHNSVDRGDAFRILQKEAALDPTSIEEIHRQKGDYRKAVKTISEGKLVEGYDMLDDQKAITEETDDEARYKTLAGRYADAALKKGAKVLTVAPTHAEGKRVTDAIRDELKQRKHIKGNEISSTRYKNLQLTEAERGDSFNFEEDQMIRFQLNAKGEHGRINKGDQFTVSKVDKKNVWITDEKGVEQTLDLKQAKRFNIYQPQEINLASGDSVRITEGHKSKDGKRLNNGSIYPIRNISKKGEITLSNGFVLDKEKGNFDYGYVTTSHASQGKTVDHVFIAQGTDYSGASSAEQFYVSVSRGKKSVEIFTDDKQALREQIQRSHQRTSATELVGNSKTSSESNFTTDNIVASLEFYARQFLSHLRGTAEDWLSSFRGDSSHTQENAKWRDHIAQQEIDRQKDRDISL